MKRLFTVAVAMAACAISAVAVADDVKSGLEPGTSVGAFLVKDCTGPAKGKTLCYRCRYGNRPTVSVFTRELNEDVAKLVKQIDDQVGKNEDKKMAAFVVYITDDAQGAQTQLTELAEKHGITNTPLTIFTDAAGPDGYNVAKDAAVTVTMWVNGKVSANHGFGKAALNKAEVEKVVGDTSKILE